MGFDRNSGVAPLRWELDPAVFFEDAVGSPADGWQANLLRSGARNRILNASRQSGKSQVCAILALHHALFNPNSLVLVLAPALRQSQELFQKVLGALQNLGTGLDTPTAERRLSLELENGSRILTLPGSEKTIRGFSAVSLLIMDEASRVPDELYFAVRPMLAVSDGSLVMLSTPYGKMGVFYEAWENQDGWERYRVAADEVNRISPEFLEEERLALPPFVYRQEYECSFEDTEDQVFTHAMVDRVVSSDVKPLFGAG
jgi:Terminase large subunit, T4likevirus-type, N-terminal